MLCHSYRSSLPSVLGSCPFPSEGSCCAPFGPCCFLLMSSPPSHSGDPPIGNAFPPFPSFLPSFLSLSFPSSPFFFLSYFFISGFCSPAQPRSILGICKAPVWFLASFGDDLSICFKGLVREEGHRHYATLHFDSVPHLAFSQLHAFVVVQAGVGIHSVTALLENHHWLFVNYINAFRGL